MDGHAAAAPAVRGRAPSSTLLPPPAPPPAPPPSQPQAAPFALPRHNRVSISATAGSRVDHRVDQQRVDHRVDARVDPRYEYPFPDEVGLPCCLPHRVSVPAAATKDRGVPGVAVLVDEFEDRDPNRINQHIQVLWEDVVAEPDGVRSPDMSWRGSARLFRLARDLVYSTLACVLGPPLALLLGGGFAVIAFLYIWVVSPALRACRLALGALSTLLRAAALSTLAPVSEALGFFCTNIRVRVQGGETVAEPLLP